MDEEIRILERDAKLARYRWRKALQRVGQTWFEEGDIVEVEVTSSVRVYLSSKSFIPEFHYYEGMRFRAKITSMHHTPLFFQFLDPKLALEYDSPASPCFNHFGHKITLVDPAGLT